MSIDFCIILGVIGWVIVTGMIRLMNRIYVFTQLEIIITRLRTRLIRLYLQYDCYMYRAERSPHNR